MLKALTADDLVAVLRSALTDEERGLGREHIEADPEALELMARAADGDARRALNMLELGVGLAQAGDTPHQLDVAVAREVAGGGHRRFDKGGDHFYEQISALHKARRGSLLVVPQARRGLRPALHRTSGGAHGERGPRAR